MWGRRVHPMGRVPEKEGGDVYSAQCAEATPGDLGQGAAASAGVLKAAILQSWESVGTGGCPDALLCLWSGDLLALLSEISA